MVAGGAIDLHEVARPEILDASGIGVSIHPPNPTLWLGGLWKGRGFGWIARRDQRLNYRLKQQQPRGTVPVPYNSLIPITDEQAKLGQEALKVLQGLGSFVAKALGDVPETLVNYLGG